MSRDQKPGRANIIDGSAKQGRAALPVAPPPVVAATGPLPAPVAPVRVKLFAILFVVSSAIAGTGVAVITRLLP